MKRRHRLSTKLTLAAGILLLFLWAAWGALYVLDISHYYYNDVRTSSQLLNRQLILSNELNRNWQPDPATPEERWAQQRTLFLRMQSFSTNYSAAVAVATVQNPDGSFSKISQSHAGIRLSNTSFHDERPLDYFVVLDKLDADTIFQLDQRMEEERDAWWNQNEPLPTLTLEGRLDGFFFYPRQITLGEETFLVDPAEAVEETCTLTPTGFRDDRYFSDMYSLEPRRLARTGWILYMDGIHRIVEIPQDFDAMELDEEMSLWTNRPSGSMLCRHAAGDFAVTPTSYEDYGRIGVRTLVQAYPLALAFEAARPTLIATFLLTLFCVYLFYRIFRRGIVRPLAAVTEESRKLARLEFDQFAPDTARKDEIGRLGRTLSAVADQLQKRWDDERDLEKRRQEFVASASHDLKTPLALIGGYAEAIAQGISPEENARYLDAIEREAGRMNVLVLEMLDYTKLERMEQLENAASMSLAPLIESLLQEMEPLLSEKNVTVDLDPAARIKGDETLLRRAIGNLLSNAAKFTPPGKTITVTLQAVRPDKPKFGGWLSPALPLLTVENQGDPIPPEDLPRIFEMFFRGDKARDRSGSGLGLAITRRIFALHHMTCRAENVPGGVRFTVAPEEEPDLFPEEA